MNEQRSGNHRPERVALYTHVPGSNDRALADLAILRRNAAERGWDVVAEFVDRGAGRGKRTPAQTERPARRFLRGEARGDRTRPHPRAHATGTAMTIPAACHHCGGRFETYLGCFGAYTCPHCRGCIREADPERILHGLVCPGVCGAPLCLVFEQEPTVSVVGACPICRADLPFCRLQMVDGVIFRPVLLVDQAAEAGSGPFVGVSLEETVRLERGGIRP